MPAVATASWAAVVRYGLEGFPAVTLTRFFYKPRGIDGNGVDCCGNSAVIGKDFAEIPRVRYCNWIVN